MKPGDGKVPGVIVPAKQRDSSSDVPVSPKTTLRAGTTLRHRCYPDTLCSINVVDGLPGAIDIRYLEARYVSLVAVGTSIDGIRPGEGVVGDAAGQSNDLAINRRGGQRDIAAGLDAGEADGGELIKAIRTVNMHSAVYRTARLSDTAGNRRRGHPQNRGSRAELPIACNVHAV